MNIFIHVIIIVSIAFPERKLKNILIGQCSKIYKDRQSRFKGHMKATLKSVWDLDAISGSEMVCISETKKIKHTLIWLWILLLN